MEIMKELEILINRVSELEKRLELATANEDSRTVWRKKDIADYLGITIRTLDLSIIPDPAFPDPIKFASQRDARKPTKALRWFAGDVIRFCKSKQKGRC